MKELLSLTEVRQLTEDVENGVSPVLITGVSPVHRAQVEAALHLKTRRPLVVLCPDEREARRQAGDLAVLTGQEPLVLPARELQWRPMEASRQWENQRLAALYRLGSSPVVVTTPEALVQRCIPPRVLERTVLTLAVGQRWDLGDLARRLAGAGYTRCDQVVFSTPPPSGGWKTAGRPCCFRRRRCCRPGRRARRSRRPCVWRPR